MLRVEGIVVASGARGQSDLCLDARRRRPRRSGERLRVPPRIAEGGIPKSDLRQSTRGFLTKLEEFKSCGNKFGSGKSEVISIFSSRVGSKSSEGAVQVSDRKSDVAGEAVKSEETCPRHRSLPMTRLGQTGVESRDVRRLALACCRSRQLGRGGSIGREVEGGSRGVSRYLAA
jgi:hypothetical protein